MVLLAPRGGRLRRLLHSFHMLLTLFYILYNSFTVAFILLEEFRVFLAPRGGRLRRFLQSFQMLFTLFVAIAFSALILNLLGF